MCVSQRATGDLMGPDAGKTRSLGARHPTGWPAPKWGMPGPWAPSARNNTAAAGTGPLSAHFGPGHLAVDFEGHE